VLLYRQSIDSEVFSDPHLWHLFSWCLFKANYKDKVFKGTLVPRGSFVSGRFVASEQLGIPPATWYKRMKRLEQTGCISIKGSSKFSVVTIVKYEQYQSGDGGGSSGGAAKEQRGSSKGAAKEQRSSTRETKEQGNKETRKQKRERKSFVAPDLETVKKQCEAKGYPMEEGEAFHCFYESKGWMVGKNKMVKWTQALAGWMARNKRQAAKSQPKTFQQIKTDNTHNAVELVKPAISAGMSFDDLYIAKQKAEQNQNQKRLEN
tara:strand:- start:489 stop:1274 length:786 start_codon:yes stop_codon:yes gene_type:complete